MPLFLTLGNATGLLAIFEPRMGRKPPSANTAWTLLGVPLSTHGFTPLLGYDNTIQTNLIGESTPRSTVGLICAAMICLSQEQKQKGKNGMIKESEE